jgi:hypothetical protein
MDTLEKIKELTEAISVEANKFYSKGNKSAVTRARSSAQELREVLKNFRVQILEDKKNANN